MEKHFGATQVLEDISFDLEQGQALAIIGSSGSGKTTLLRCLNFLETPDQGIIKVAGETLFDGSAPATRSEAAIRKKRLHFGLVFQSFNLFPQYTALENVTLAGRLLARERQDYKADKRRIVSEIEANGRELLARMGLSDREIRSTINKQVLMVFFLPLGMAVVHIAVAFPVLCKLLLAFNMANRLLFLGCTAGAVLLFAAVYYIVYHKTSKTYYRIVQAK